MLNSGETLLFSDPKTTVTLEYYNYLKRVKLTPGCLLTGCQLRSDMLKSFEESTCRLARSVECGSFILCLKTGCTIIQPWLEKFSALKRSSLCRARYKKRGSFVYFRNRKHGMIYRT